MTTKKIRSINMTTAKAKTTISTTMTTAATRTIVQQPGLQHGLGTLPRLQSQQLVALTATS